MVWWNSDLVLFGNDPPTVLFSWHPHGVTIGDGVILDESGDVLVGTYAGNIVSFFKEKEICTNSISIISLFLFFW